MSRQPWLGYIAAIVITGIAAGISYLLDHWLLPTSGTVLILQLAVLLVAFLTNFRAALLAAIAALLLFNFLFTEPRYSLHMTDIDEIVTAIVFITVAVITSHLATSFRLQKESLRQAQLRSNILLSVSHDLRTPLASVIGNLSTLQAYQERLPEHERAELLQGALDESDRLHRYIENLLQATRLQHGEIRLTHAVQDIRPVISKTIARFPAQSRLLVHDSLQYAMVEVQSSLLEQALFNIIDNALRFSGDTAPVSINLYETDNTIIIDIKDEGPGIDSNKRALVFSVFYSSREKDSGTGGTGLGLSVAKGIIDTHNGQISIEDSNKGCLIRIALPRASMTEEVK
ncbi:MAG: sensor histidine kinase [Pseudomonadota bacterium]